MTEQELRALVRQAIEERRSNVPSDAATDGRRFPTLVASAATHPREHASHGLFVLSSGADAGGPCIIEPAVPCNHCGYCKSLGH
jgi:hypothetical protein